MEQNQHTQGGLPALIAANLEGRSLRQIARESGGELSSAQLSGFASRGMKNFPVPETIKALARSLKVSPGEVVRASAVSLGIPMAPASDDALIIWGAGVLPESNKQLLEDTARAMPEWKSLVESADADAPLTTAEAAEEPAQDWHSLAAEIQSEPTDSQRQDEYFDQLGEDPQ